MLCLVQSFTNTILEVSHCECGVRKDKALAEIDVCIYALTYSHPAPSETDACLNLFVATETECISQFAVAVVAVVVVVRCDFTGHGCSGEYGIVS
jgi:hypothetical protein